jgi:glucose-6-phosphate isomerase
MKYFNIKGKLFSNFQAELDKLIEEKIIERIWNKDYTVWSNNPTEIVNRLGWLDCINFSRKKLDDIYSFVDDIRKEGFTDVLLLGIGGSSLAPEVFGKVFGKAEEYLNIHVLDSTHPDAVKQISESLNPSSTLYIVSTKSGGTIETISFMKYFYNYVKDKLGINEVAKHFIAITDPNSGLEEIANKLKFRKVFLNDPNIGGRFSALSLFGVLPAAFLGIDLQKLFVRADHEILASRKSGDFIDLNISSQFGLLISILAKDGKDKLTLITSDKFKSFGAWVEQLLAESTGKNGKGILPIDLEELLPPDLYSTDRLFVIIKIKDDKIDSNKIDLLKNAGFPIIEFELEDIYDLGRMFFMWEFATAISGWSLGIQPFDQPNVEQSKVVARKIITEYHSSGELDLPISVYDYSDMKIYFDKNFNGLKEAIPALFSNSLIEKNYLAIHAYLNPTEEIFGSLQILREKFQVKFKLSTTLGFGPRFLHSTGQLHKGDAGNGIFIQFIDNSDTIVEIPDEPGNQNSSTTFGVLIKAQAFGDRKALLDNGRKVLTFDLGKNVIDNLKIIHQSF